MRDRLSKADQGLHVFRCVREDVTFRRPRPRFAEQQDGRSPELEDRLFIAAFERPVEGVFLHNASHRERADLHETKPAEIFVSTRFIARSLTR